MQSPGLGDCHFGSNIHTKLQRVVTSVVQLDQPECDGRRLCSQRSEKVSYSCIRAIKANQLIFIVCVVRLTPIHCAVEPSRTIHANRYFENSVVCENMICVLDMQSIAFRMMCVCVRRKPQAAFPFARRIDFFYLFRFCPFFVGFYDLTT